MIEFLFRRTFQAIIVLFIVVSGTFLLMRMAPGSPFQGEREVLKHIEEEAQKKFGLNGTLPEQLARYWSNLLSGDLGPSIKLRGRQVSEVIAESLPASLMLGGLSFVLAMLLGILLGTIAAMYQHHFLDRAAMLLALAGICFPAFVIAPVFALIFTIYLPLFPIAGWGTPAHLVLPAICLALPYSAYVARLMRTSMLEVLRQDYIRTARAKGLPESRVVFHHALKTGILPLVSFSGPLAAHLLTGSLVIERIFWIPGMGSFFVQSVLDLDYFMVGGVVIVYCVLLMSFNVIVDWVYTLLDRRIQLS